MSGERPSVAVIVANDFPQGGWGTERACLRALAAQTYDGPIEVLLMVRDDSPEPPDEVLQMAPSARVVRSAARDSSAMKNEGTLQAQADFVALVDADCFPAPGWLAALVDALLAHPDFSVASGLITYGSETMARRVLGLLHRGYIVRPTGRTIHFADNGSVFRRATALRIPYPADPNPFIAPWLRNSRLIEADVRMWFEPSARMLHDFPDWRFVLDVQRSTGYADMRMAPGGPRFGAIPGLCLSRIRDQWRTLVHAGRHYLRWYDYPGAVAAVVLLRIGDIAGMVDVVRGRDAPGGTRYR